jgi:hypothetical protein
LQPFYSFLRVSSSTPVQQLLKCIIRERVCTKTHKSYEIVYGKAEEMCNSIEHSWRLRDLLFPHRQEADCREHEINKHEEL